MTSLFVISTVTCI